MNIRALVIVLSGIAATAHAQTDATQGAGDEQSSTAATVHVLVEDVESDKGTVWLALCNTELSIDGCPYKTSVPAALGSVEATFEDIPPGDYAVAGFHDANGNDQFDKILGVPREPYGLSGAAGDMLVPHLQDALLPIKAGENDVVIRMKRLGQ